MPSVEARFYVSGYERNAWDTSVTSVKLQAVSRGPHNKEWAAATPSGQIQMNIRNEGAAGWFVDRLGKEIAITFTEAPADEGLCWPHDYRAGSRRGDHRPRPRGKVLPVRARDPSRVLLRPRLAGRACLGRRRDVRPRRPARLDGGPGNH